MVAGLLHTGPAVQKAALSKGRRMRSQRPPYLDEGSGPALWIVDKMNIVTIVGPSICA